MARKIIDIGVKGNDGTGDPIRDAFRKINDNFQELYTSLGLVQGFTFLSLSDTPNTFVGQSDSLVSVNKDGTALVFKQLVAGTGINLDLDANQNEIKISAAFADIVIDETPQLGGPLSATSGGVNYPIGGLPDLTNFVEQEEAVRKLSVTYPTISQAGDTSRLAVNKKYADTKLSIAGVDAEEFRGIDEQGNPIIVSNPNFGIMTGPLVLARDPITEDDELWDGKTAATKRYVDGASYYSRINLHVSTAGNDSREDIAREKQGRALAYAFRTVEAACKKAEELILESKTELGPYKKILTYNNGANFCTLTSITTSADSGTGCTAIPIMSVDSFVLVSGGSAYKVGDIVTIAGGVGTDPAAFEVVSINEGTGSILEVKLLKSGVYTEIPGATSVGTTTNSTFGSLARFNLTYRVSAIQVTDPGQDYGLVSVRVTGGGGSGVFGFADVVNGEVISITVTEQGSGFTSLPTVTVELPTFRIKTGGVGTDFTNSQGPSRDIREGLYLRGETSGALANILSHSGVVDGQDELFDVDFISGSFEIGERISYGLPIKEQQITIFVESGIYEENFPIKVPANVSIKGDEFRRSIIRPRVGMSTSPWANVKFRRDTNIDGLTVANQTFGYHYLTDSTAPIYPLVSNAGGYRSANQIVKSNRDFIQAEVIGWINAQIQAGNQPFTGNFTYNQDLCKRDVGLIVDAVAFDLRWGGDNRTVSAGLKYYEGVTSRGNSLIAINEQYDQTVAAMEYTRYLIGQCLDGLPPAVTYTDIDQILDPAYVAETGAKTIAENLVNAIISIVTSTDNFNAPKDNTLMDVFLMNDTTILRNLTIQGNGGFAMVLDPDGQILTKSPYAQVGTVFSRSTGYHTFAGGIFVDGFAGNLEFEPVSKTSDTLIEVTNFVRKPQVPCSFQVNGVTYRINYFRNWIYNSAGSSCTLVLDETTPFTGSIPTGVTWETITAGNRSMLSNDFTQLCDMGYGILATNGGLVEAVSAFTYYCYTSFFALNGAQIRSVGGSSAHGVYGLKAEGSDPLEVPITAELLNNVSQGAVVYAEAGYENSLGGLFIYVDGYSYIPYNQCQLEIDHGNNIVNYIVVNVEYGGSLPANVIKLNLSSAATTGQFSGGLVAQVPNNTPVTIRLNNQIRLQNLSSTFTTRPSTALIFEESPDFVYRVTTLSTADLPSGQAQATFREPYQYIDTKVWSGGAQPATYGAVGNTKIAVDPVSSNEISRLVGSQFGWKGTVHTISLYKTPAQTGQAWGELQFSPGLAYAVSGFTNTPTLRIGSQAGLQGSVTVKISTCRVTGHDMLDIGTGSYADTNYPEVIYGEPANTPVQENEVREVGKGRVFYVTSDQDGNFRVGPFFAIDQASGTVSFSADLALNNLDGIGFKRGVTISEFSIDGTMSDNDTDAVPTESAVRSYVERRLGVSHTGGSIAQAALIPANTGGFMALNGQLPMKGNLDMNGANRIIQLSDPVNPQDAVTKSWTKLSNLQDGTLTNPANKDFVMLTGNQGTFLNVANNTTAISNTSTSNGGGSDVALTRTNNTLTIKLVGGQGAANPITDYHINNNAEIQQSKLLMQLAGERTEAPTGTAKQKQATAGLASFKSTEFTVTDGFVELQTSDSTTSGVTLGKLQWINGRSVIGNSSVNNAAASNITFTDVVDFGLAVKKGQYTAVGYLKRKGAGNTNDTDFEIINDATANTADTLVKRDSSGNFSAGTVDVTQLKVDTKLVADTQALTGTDTGVIKLYAYRGSGGISLGDGAESTDKVNTYENDKHVFRSLNGLFNGVIQAGTLTTGAAATAGTLTGSWSLGDNSKLTAPATTTIDASLGTLKSLTLTTGADATGGTITGAWTLNGASSLSLQASGVINATLGTLKSRTLTTDAAATTGSITGTWTLTNGSSLAPGSGTITATKSTNVILDQADAATSYHYVTFTSAVTGDQQIRTDAQFRYRPDLNRLFVGAVYSEATNLTIKADDRTGAGNADGYILNLYSGNGLGTGAGGALVVAAGQGGSGAGGLTTVAGGAGGSTGGNGGNAILKGGEPSSGGFGSKITTYGGARAGGGGGIQLLGGAAFGTNQTGGLVEIAAGTGTGSGAGGAIEFHTAPAGTSGTTAGTLAKRLAIAASGQITMLSNIAATNTTSGTLVVTGGVGVSGTVYAGGFNGPLTGNVSGNVTGDVTGNVTGNVSGTAGSITNQANSATITATSANEANKIVLRDVNGDFSANIITGTATQARYADLAERYAADKEYKPGTVVIFGGTAEITQSNKYMDRRVAGVISTNPAHLMNAEAGNDKTHPAVALQGRVPCKVVGKVQKGDMLVTSTIPGVAIAAEDPAVGTVIGKALENYDSDHIGLIEVVVGRY